MRGTDEGPKIRRLIRKKLLEREAAITLLSARGDGSGGSFNEKCVSYLSKNSLTTPRDPAEKEKTCSQIVAIELKDRGAPRK